MNVITKQSLAKTFTINENNLSDIYMNLNCYQTVFTFQAGTELKATLFFSYISETYY